MGRQNVAYFCGRGIKHDDDENEERCLLSGRGRKTLLTFIGDFKAKTFYRLPILHMHGKGAVVQACSTLRSP